MKMAHEEHRSDHAHKSENAHGHNASQGEKNDSEELFDRTLNSLLGFIILGALLFAGLWIVASSIEKLATKVDSLSTKIEGLKYVSANEQRETGETDPANNKSESKFQPESTVIDGQTFYKIDYQIDLSKAAGVLGDKNAPVKIIEFSDYQCPYCRRLYMDAGKQIKEEYVKQGKAVYYFFDFPLSFHPEAQMMAVAARCAGEKGKYFDMHDKLFEYQNTLGGGTVRVTEQEVIKLAKEIGLEEKSFTECLSSGKYDSAITENMQIGIANMVQGTPMLIINGWVVPGAFPYQFIRQLIEKELK